MRSGQPALALMRLHFCPLLLSSGFLSSLPFSTKIPTASLIDSSLPTDDNFTLNGVRIDWSPLYADEDLTVYGIRDFFDPSFQISTPLQGTPDLLCASRINDSKLNSSDSPGRNAFDRALKVMRTGGYSIMASVLALQLIGFEYKTRTFTLFALTDKVLLGRAGNVSELSSLFLHNVVPCKLARIDLANFIQGLATPIYSQGFKIRVRAAYKTMTINWVGIAHPKLHRRDWIVLHGIQDIIGVYDEILFNSLGIK